MKLIILDHFRRWWLVFTIIFAAYFIFQAIAIRENHSQTSANQTTGSVQHTIDTAHNIFIFQAIIWLGFLLTWDLQRGLPRVLTSLPVTAKQIGRNWWVVSVAFPTIAIGIIGLIAVLIFSDGTNTKVLLKNHLMNWVLTAFFLGAMFGSQTFIRVAMPNTFMGRVRKTFLGSLFALTIVGIVFIQLETLKPWQTILFYGVYFILSMLGWFRAERMVLQRASFRLIEQSSNKKTTSDKIPQGFGGLPYLVQRTFIQSIVIGLTLMFFMALVMSFVAHGQNRAQEIDSMMQGGSTPYAFYILIFSIVPIVFQIRFLRTLPISPSNLAAIFIFLPVISIAAVGIIITIVAGFVAGDTIILPAANSFLMLAAKTAIIVPLVVWRGLEAPVYILTFLLVLSDSLVSLGMTIIFHLGSKSPTRPWWVNLSIFLICLAVSFALTRRLLTKSSRAYRVRTMPASAWSMARR